MRKYLLAAAAVAAIASPAMARDGAGYFGVEGGILFPRHNNNGNVTSVTTTSITPAVVAPATTSGPAVVTTTTTNYNNGFANNYKRGLDLDAIAGFDFGMFRLEGELGYKRTRQKDFTASSGVLSGINTAPFSGVTSNNFVFAGNRTTVLSVMVNGLVDFGVAPGVSLYAGGGVGRARVKAYGDRDSAWAWQLIAGASTAITPNIDLGLKYRYFQTGRLNFNNIATVTTTGTVTGATGPSNFSSVYSTSGNKFRSHSLLASLIFNFGGTEAAPPPPPPPAPEVAPPPPPPPPATQTCPDGSVIDATATCPVPPPPPPAPPARGERG